MVSFKEFYIKHKNYINQRLNNVQVDIKDLKSNLRVIFLGNLIDDENMKEYVDLAVDFEQFYTKHKDYVIQRFKDVQVDIEKSMSPYINVEFDIQQLKSHLTIIYKAKILTDENMKKYVKLLAGIEPIGVDILTYLHNEGVLTYKNLKRLITMEDSDDFLNGLTNSENIHLNQRLFDACMDSEEPEHLVYGLNALHSISNKASNHLLNTDAKLKEQCEDLIIESSDPIDMGGLLDCLNSHDLFQQEYINKIATHKYVLLTSQVSHYKGVNRNDFIYIFKLCEQGQVKGISGEIVANKIHQYVTSDKSERKLSMFFTSESSEPARKKQKTDNQATPSTPTCPKTPELDIGHIFGFN